MPFESAYAARLHAEAHQLSSHVYASQFNGQIITQEILPNPPPTQRELEELGSGKSGADLLRVGVPSVFGGMDGHEAVERRIGEILEVVWEQGMAEQVSLFGVTEDFDASHFTARGHYTKSELLTQYFKSMMWLGRWKLQVAGKKGAGIEGLAGTVVLEHLLSQVDGGWELWTELNKFTTAFTGQPTTMTVAEVRQLLNNPEPTTTSLLQYFTDAASLLKELQLTIKSAPNLGISGMNNPFYVSTNTTAQPRKFAFMPQRFALDAFSLSHAVNSSMPSALDVAFTIFNNDASSSFLESRIEAKEDELVMESHRERLLALRHTMETLPKAAWKDSLYSHWLRTLRKLTAHRDGKNHTVPQVMRTMKWGIRNMDAQIASWTQLRHDTVLYVEQSEDIMTCEHPAVYVEPIPEFWEALMEMSQKASALFTNTTSCGLLESLERVQKSLGNTNTKGLASIRQHSSDHFESFSNLVSRLLSASQTLSTNQPLSNSQYLHLRNLVHITYGPGNYLRTPNYEGWYPSLFYRSRDQAMEGEYIVADVHTFHTDLGSKILHEGIGQVQPMVVVVDGESVGGGEVAFVAPVWSHFEFVEVGRRLNDEIWEGWVAKGEVPERSEWSKVYLRD